MMRQVWVHNPSRPLASPLRLSYCKSFFSHLRGLTFRRFLPMDRGIVMDHSWDNRISSTITMLGVWIDLGIIWVNQDFRVVDTIVARRWRPIYIPKQAARYVLEVRPERLREFQIGDVIEFETIHMD